MTSVQEPTDVKTYVRFEAFTAVTMKNAVTRDLTQCGSCENRRFGRTYCLHHQGAKNQRAPSLQDEWRLWFMSQQIMEAGYCSQKTFEA
jgi:hypothetical protein